MGRYFVKSSNNKYLNTRVQYRGIWFDSTKERDRYIYLCSLQRQGKILSLRLKTGFLLIPKLTKTVEIPLKTKVRYEERVVEEEAGYHNDFTYIENGVYVCEEFKSEETAKLKDYVLRRKLMMQKIRTHNEKGRSQWIFREVVYYFSNKPTTITDKK